MVGGTGCGGTVEVDDLAEGAVEPQFDMRERSFGDEERLGGWEMELGAVEGCAAIAELPIGFTSAVRELI